MRAGEGRDAADVEVEQYLDSGEWEGKAGAYAIQETGDRFVAAVEGSFTNVVGLPMELVQRMLARMDRHVGSQAEGDQQ
jgi:septum formation protein